MVSPIRGVQEQRFQNWMRAAAMPDFRKLHAVIDSDLKAGDEVAFTIEANFDDSIFGGTKSLVLTTTTWFGGKNDFLGSCLAGIGAVCLVFGIGFIGKQLSNPRPLGDLTKLG